MRLTVDGFLEEAKAVGADIPMLENLGEDGYKQVIAMGVRNFCAETGQAADLALAEQFRYQKFGMLDKILGTDFVEADF